MTSIVASIALAAVVLSVSTVPASAQGHKGVSSSTIVNAPKEAVWQVLSEFGHFDDKLHSMDGNDPIVEQRFRGLPLMGGTSVLLKAKAKPMERIDFHMIKADKIKEFSGAWTLDPISAHKTKVHLTMNIDTGLPAPRILINQYIHGRVKSRLRTVKMLAEKSVHKQPHGSHSAAK